MSDYELSRRFRRRRQDAGVVDEGLRAYMLRVYNYMLLGLTLTGVTAFLTADTAFGQLFFQMQNGVLSPNILGWIAIFAPLAFVLILGFGINRMSASTAQLVFWGYAGIMGIGMATILFAYTLTSVAQVFFITAATFGAMSLWGYTTKRDLTGMGSFLMMGLIGLIIAMVVNIFLHSSMMAWIISVIGVLIFTGLTAYDTQKIKESYSVSADGEAMKKGAIMGALQALSRLPQPVPVPAAAPGQPALGRRSNEAPDGNIRGFFFAEPASAA